MGNYPNEYLDAALAARGVQRITSPLDIDDCVLWLDASDATTINAGSPADNDPVSTWADKSGNNYDAAQATAEAMPAFKTNIVNGLSVVRYDSSLAVQFLALSGNALSMLSAADGVTVAAVYVNRSTVVGAVGEQDLFTVHSPQQDAGENGYPKILQCGFDSTGQILEGFYSNNAASEYAGIGGSTAAIQEPYGGDTADYDNNSGVRAIIYSFDAAASGRAAIVTTYQMGAGQVNSSLSPPVRLATPGPFPVGAANSITIGGSGAGYFSDYPLMDGDYCMLAVWSRHLTARERRDVIEYVSQKWGVL